jgi:hypothetical protein
MPNPGQPVTTDKRNFTRRDFKPETRNPNPKNQPSPALWTILRNIFNPPSFTASDPLRAPSEFADCSGTPVRRVGFGG